MKIITAFIVASICSTISNSQPRLTTMQVSVGALDGGNRLLDPSGHTEFGFENTGYHNLLFDDLITGIDITRDLNNKYFWSFGWWLTRAEMGFNCNVPVYSGNIPLKFPNNAVYRNAIIETGTLLTTNIHTFPLMIGWKSPHPIKLTKKIKLKTTIETGPVLQYMRRYATYKQNFGSFRHYYGIVDNTDSTVWLTTSRIAHMNQFGMAMRLQVQWTLTIKERSVFFFRIMADQGFVNLIREQVNITRNGELKYANQVITRGSFWGIAAGVPIVLNRRAVTKYNEARNNLILK